MLNTILKGFGKKETEGLASVAKDLLGSFFSKPKEENIAEWLGNALQKHLSSESQENLNKMNRGIFEGIAAFNEKMLELEKNRAASRLNEEWLRDKISQIPVGQDINYYGKYLEEVQNSLAVGNTIADKIFQSGENVTVDLGKIEDFNIESGQKNFDKYDIREIAMNIAKQSEMTSALIPAYGYGAELALEATENIPSFNREDIIESELNDENDIGIKTVAAGALGICVKLGKIPLLEKITPIGTITDIACCGVENTKALYKFATGKMSAHEAVEHMGRATSAAVANICSKGIGKKICSMIPVLGPTVGLAVGTVIDQIAGKHIGNVLQTGIRKIKPFAATVLQGTKNVVNKVTDTVKNVADKVFNFFGL